MQATATKRELTDAQLARVSEINQRLAQLNSDNHGVTAETTRECVSLVSERADLLGLNDHVERHEGGDDIPF